MYELINMNQIVKGSLAIRLLVNNIYTVEDLLKYDVEGLLKIEGISLFNIAVLKNKLNELGYHLRGEEIVEFDDYYDDEREKPLKCCDVIVEKKRELEKRIIEVEIDNENSYREDNQKYLNVLYNLEKDLDYAFETLLNYVREKREEKIGLNK